MFKISVIFTHSQVRDAIGQYLGRGMVKKVQMA